MHPPCRHLSALSLGLTLAAIPVVPGVLEAQSASSTRRAITPADISAWKSIRGATLSSDGAWFAHVLAPTEGDAEVIVRQTTAGGKVLRFPIGEAPAGGGAPVLAADGRWVAMLVYPKAAEQKKLRQQFDGDYKVSFHLAPPLFADRDPVTGELKKSEFGAWMMPAFRLLASRKGLRGGRFDIFGYSEERRMERRLIGEYEATVETLLATLGQDNHALAVQIASVPETMRGFGHVKEASVKVAKAAEEKLWAQWG